VGLGAINNGQENYNSLTKGTRSKEGVVSAKSRGPGDFHTKSVPELCEHAANFRSGYAIIIPPTTTILPVNQVLLRIQQEFNKQDVREIKREEFKDLPGLPENIDRAFYVRAAHSAGRHINPIKIFKYKSALAGDTKPFIKDKESKSPREPRDVMNYMINTTSSFCVVTYKKNVDGSSTIIGDCIHCYKKLQCRGCILVADKLGINEFDSTIRCESLLNRKRGSPQQKNLGGLGGRVEKEEASADLRTFLSHFNKQILLKVCEALHIPIEDKKKTTQLMLLGVILCWKEKHNKEFNNRKKDKVKKEEDCEYKVSLKKPYKESNKKRRLND